jgi:hypothetical protein
LEELEPLVFPYAFEVTEKGQKKEASKEVEIAFLFLRIWYEWLGIDGERPLIEKFKEKIGKKHSKTVKNLSVTKIFYPLWAKPWKDETCLIIEGLGIFHSIIDYDELPDVDSFLNDIKEVNSAEDYLASLRKHQVTFACFRGSRSFAVSGLVPHESFVYDLQPCMAHFRREEIAKAVSLPPRVSWEQVEEIFNIFTRMYADASEGIKKLTSAKDLLVHQTYHWSLRQIERIKEIESEFLPSIEKESKTVETKLAKLYDKYQSQVTEVEKTLISTLDMMEKDSYKLEGEIRELKQKREEYSRILSELKPQKERLERELKKTLSQQDVLSTQLHTLTMRLSDLKMEYSKLQGLVETHKGGKREEEIRKPLKKIEQEMGELNQKILEIRQETRKKEETRQKVQSSISEIERRIYDLKEKIVELEELEKEKRAHLASLPREMEDTRIRAEEEHQKIEKHYRSQVKDLQAKVPFLKAEMRKKIRVEQKTIYEMKKRTEEIRKQIDCLIESQTAFIDSLQKYVITTKGMKVAETTVLQIPFYHVCYETSEGISEKIYPPMIGETVKEALGRKRIVLKPANVGFEKILGAKLLEALKCDGTLSFEVRESSSVVDLVKDSETLRVLYEGLDRLSSARLISNSQAQQVKMAFTPYLSQGLRPDYFFQL